MIDRLGLATDELDQRRLGRRVRSRKYFDPAIGIEGRCLQDAPAELHRFQQHGEIARALQVVGKDQRGVARVVGAQADATAALGPEIAGVQREAVSRQAVAPMIVELRRDEMHLNIRPSVRRLRAAHERAGLGHVRDTRAAMLQPVAQRDPEFLEWIESYVTACVLLYSVQTSR